MMQITDKLFAFKIDEDAETSDFGLEIEPEDEWYQLIYTTTIKDEESGFYGEDVEYNVELPAGKYKILGTVGKETIDFDVEPYVIESVDFPEYRYGGEVHPKETYFDYERGIFCGSIEGYGESFRTLLASKGCDPNAKHLIIQKI